MILPIKPVVHWSIAAQKSLCLRRYEPAMMTRRPKAKQDEQGRFISNKAKQKSGLNKAILNVGWHKIETYRLQSLFIQ